MRILLSLAAFFIYGKTIVAQATKLNQTVKGIVIDADSKKPLMSVTVSIANTAKSVITDADGAFTFTNVTIGRISLEISSIGYEARIIPEVIVTSGKEIALNIGLVEKIKKEEEVVVVTKRNRIKPNNEFASSSARAISMEETKRYPAAIYDPARMVQNFAGVSSSDDGNNSIVVRGNSPQGVLYKLEGIEIPSPNHFGGLGTSGGAISMLSSSTLGTSDFYSGAFPAEFGNATSGVIDLNFRNGNKNKREYAFMIGSLGIEGAAEGAFKKGGKSSYLINYRYSTLGLIGSFVGLSNEIPKYQDASFKFNFPTKNAGTFNLFGLLGFNESERKATKDSAKWTDEDRNFSYTLKSSTTILGLSHQIFLGNKSYIKTTLAVTGFKNESSVDTLTPYAAYKAVLVAKEKNTDNNFRITSYYNNKLNNKATLRIGAIFSSLKFNYVNSALFTVPATALKNLLAIDGNTTYLQGYAQLKYRLTERLTLNTGVHASVLALNNTSSIEPRAAITYTTNNSQTFTFAVGLHAKPQQLSTYYYETVDAGQPRTNANKKLKMTNATHFVLGYEKGFKNGIRLKTEAYYQLLNNIPVEAKRGSGFSVINAQSVFDLYNTNPLAGTGKGTNYGLDINLEKSFSKNYYFITNLSLYNSNYTNFDKKTFNTRFNKGYQLNLIGGKEWKMGKRNNNNKSRTFGFNGKTLFSGGNRESEIDLAASRLSGQQELVAGKFFTQIAKAYSRIDIGISFKTNRQKSTRTLSLNIQNLLNNKNESFSFYDNNAGRIIRVLQLGLVPILNYRIEF
jgi:CarboxypepD_reg-like domain/TonB dependent receptor/TonB-dependent Receptor Plug Domain